MTHLEHAEYSLKRTHNKEPLSEILFLIIGHLKEQKQYGFYQLCPKCDGEGSVSTNGLSTSSTRICPVCAGQKILVRPEII